MRRALPFWAKAGAPAKLLRWIAKGVDLPFQSAPPPHCNPNPTWEREELDYWRSCLLPKMLQEGAIRQVETPTPWVSASRLEPKRSGGYRHLVDLRPINDCLAVPRCKFETLQQLPFLARSGDGGISVDMQSGYYALGIDPLF